MNMAAKDPAGWYYVGNAELRYMDTEGWTDQYKPSCGHVGEQRFGG